MDGNEDKDEELLENMNSCSICHLKGHFSYNCLEKDNKGNWVICTKCGYEGHYQSVCQNDQRKVKNCPSCKMDSREHKHDCKYRSKIYYFKNSVKPKVNESMRNFFSSSETPPNLSRNRKNQSENKYRFEPESHSFVTGMIIGSMYQD